MLEIWVKKMLFVPRMNGKATESPNLLPCFCLSFSPHVEQHLPKQLGSPTQSLSQHWCFHSQLTCQPASEQRWVPVLCRILWELKLLGIMVVCPLACLGAHSSLDSSASSSSLQCHPSFVPCVLHVALFTLKTTNLLSSYTCIVPFLTKVSLFLINVTSPL